MLEQSQVEGGNNSNSLLTIKRALSHFQRKLPISISLLIYNLVFLIIYRFWLFRYFEYFGFSYKNIDMTWWFESWIISMVPVFFLRTVQFRASTFMVLILYLLVYVPSIWMPMLIGLRPPEEVCLFQAYLMLGFLVTQFSQWVPIITIKKWKIQIKHINKILMVSYILAIFCVMYTHKFKVQILNFKEIYELRNQNSLDVTNPIIIYLEVWILNLIHPLMIVFGLQKRRFALVAYGIFIQVVMYGVTGAKTALLMIPMILIIFFIYHGDMKVFATRIGAGLALFVLGFFAIGRLWGGNDLSSSLYMAAESVFYLRTLGIAGLLSAQYHDFFLAHPLTYLSHSRIGSMFYGYPYTQSIGFEIGDYYSGAPGLNANAHFYVTDGFSAFGYPGLIFAGILALIVFVVIDAVTNKVDKRIVVSMLAFFVIGISNVSLLTVLLTGGLLFLIAIFQIDWMFFKQIKSHI